MMKRLLPVLMVVVAASAAAERGPIEVVQETTDQLFSLIDENRDHYAQHPEELRQVVREILVPKLDQLYAGRLVLGRHARGMEPEQVAEFSEALSGLLIERYAEQLLEFKSRDQMQVLPLSGPVDEDKTRVQTRVKLQSGQLAPVDYIMRRAEGDWRVFDVVVEGVSYVVTFRTQINEEIQRDGIEQTLERIRRGKIRLEADGD